MTRCKYVGQTSDQWLPTGEQCDEPVRTIADKSVSSMRVRICDGMYASHPYTWMYPSIKCPSGFCEYHWNMIRCRKLGVGKQS